MLLMTDPTDTRDAEVKCADGMACLHLGDCQARGACHIDYPYSDEYVEGLRAEITRLRALLEGHSGAREPGCPTCGHGTEPVAPDWCFRCEAPIPPATPEPAEMDGERIEGWAARDEDGERAFRTAEWFRNQGLAAHPDYERRATLILAPPDSTGEEGRPTDTEDQER